MPIDATALIGLLVGFLVVGTIGIYVGDAMIGAMDQSSSSPLFEQQKNIASTFELGVTLCKVIIIISVAAVVITLLGQTGLIPDLFGGSRGSDRSEYQPRPPEPQLQPHNVRQWRTSSTTQPPSSSTSTASEPTPASTSSSEHAYVNPFADERVPDNHLPENHYHNRFEAILEDEAELENKKG